MRTAKKTIETLKYEYPKNLLCELYGCDVNDSTITSLNDDNYKGLEYAISTLSEREQTILKERFQYRRTYQAIANDYRVSIELIRHLVFTSLIKLKNPPVRNYVIYGYIGNHRRQETYKKGNGTYSIPIEDIEFSRNTYYLLKRRGFKNTNEFKSKSQLLRYYGIGEKMVNEIVEKLQSYGIELPESGV